MLPVNLKLKNFYSHRYSEVDFSSFKSCLLIGNTEGDYSKSNGSGKSAIFESILWCLFNKSRASMIDDIVTWGENLCEVEFEFIHNDVDYKVKRTRNRMSSTSNVEFYKKGDDDWNNISGSTSGATGRKIEETISLDFKTFLNSIYFRQSDISEFAESDPARKKDILKNIIDISKWDDYEKNAKAKLKEVNFNIDLIKAKLDDFDIKTKELSDLKLLLSSEKNNLSLLSSERDSVESNIEKINKRYIMIKSNLDTDSYDQIVEKISSIEKNIKIEDVKIGECLSSIKKYEESIEGSVSSLNLELEKISSLVENPNADDELKNLNQEVIDMKSAYAAYNEHLSHLEGVLVSKDICYSCGQDISEELYSVLLDDHNKKLAEYSSKVKSSSKDLAKIERDIISTNNDISNNKILSSSNLKIKSLNLELSITRERLSSLLYEKTELDSFRKRLGNDLKLNKDILRSLKDDNFAKLRDGRSLMIKKKGTLISDIASSNKNIGILSEKILMINNEIQSLNKQKDGLESLLIDAQILERLVKMLGKNGIQTILLDAVIEDLELKSNDILSSISNEPAFIILDTQRVGSDGTSIIETLDLKVRMNGITQNFKSLSGGEQFRISLALRIALSEIASIHGGAMLEFLLLDEINSPLDRHGIETLFSNVIHSLEDRYKILIITHDASLKENFNDLIDVTKINGESSAEYMTI